MQGELDDWLAAHFRHALRLKRFAKPREGCTAPTCIEELAACTSWDAEVSSKVGFTRRDREGILIFKALLLCFETLAHCKPKMVVNLNPLSLSLSSLRHYDGGHPNIAVTGHIGSRSKS